MSIDLRPLMAIKPAGMSLYAVKRRLKALERVHGGLLYRSCPTPHGHYLVDYARLREVHPTWEDRTYATRTELADMLERIQNLETQLKQLKSKHNALVSRFRDAVKFIESQQAKMG